jgi:hypothetical protein
MPSRRPVTVLIALLLLPGFSTPTRSGQTTTPGGVRSPIFVTGQERIAWDQRGDPKRIGEVKFVVYVDGKPIDLPDARCTPRSAFHSECESPLPELARGAHSLNVVAVRRGDGVESRKGLPLNLTWVDDLPPESPVPTREAARRSNPVSTRPPTKTPDCTVAYIDEQAALMGTLDGSLEVWPRRGGAQPVPVTPALPTDWQLRGVAIREKSVFVLLTNARPDGLALRILHYVEANKALQLSSTVLDHVVSGNTGRVRLRQSPDGRLHVLLLERNGKAPEPFVIEVAETGADPKAAAGRLATGWTSARALAFEWSRPGGEPWALEETRGQLTARPAGGRQTVPLASASTAKGQLIFAGSVNGSETDVLLAVRADGAATIATRERGRWQNANQLTLPSLGVVHDGVASPVSGDLVYCTSAAGGSQAAQYDVRWRTFRR